jgi:hypothetical protein
LPRTVRAASLPSLWKTGARKGMGNIFGSLMTCSSMLYGVFEHQQVLFHFLWGKQLIHA